MALSEQAREARNAYMREWKEKNREHVNAYMRNWKKNNPEKVKQYTKNHWERVASQQQAKEG